MKTNLNLLQTRIYCVVALGIGSFFGLAAATENSADTPPATTAIPWSQLGAKAGADYQGDRHLSTSENNLEDSRLLSPKNRPSANDGTLNGKKMTTQ